MERRILATKPMKSERTQEKFFYRLEEVSRLAQTDPKVIERWEKEFPFLHAGRTGTGQKIFRQKDLQIILRLKELLLKEGLTLAGAKRRIEEEFGSKPAEAAHPDHLKKVLYAVREQLQDIADSLEKRSRKL
jgi:DNA-binding transcriptional MerR regulator